MSITRCCKTHPFHAGVECIDVLLRAGADRNIRDVDGKTALDAAIHAERFDCASALNLEIGDAQVCTA